MKITSACILFVNDNWLLLAESDGLNAVAVYSDFGRVLNRNASTFVLNFNFSYLKSKDDVFASQCRHHEP